MRVEKLHCTGNECDLIGETTRKVKVDYVFAYTPAHVRYSPGILTVDFGADVECQRFEHEDGFSYLLCAPVITDHRIEYDRRGLPVVIGLSED